MTPAELKAAQEAARRAALERERRRLGIGQPTSPPVLSPAREAREAAQREALARAHAAARAKGRPVSDAELAQLLEDARARAGVKRAAAGAALNPPGQPIAEAVEKAAEPAQKRRKSLASPKILEADVRPIAANGPELAALMREIDRQYRWGWGAGLENTKAVARRLHGWLRSQKRGHVTGIPYAEIAKSLKLSVDTVWRAIKRVLEPRGLLAVTNVLALDTIAGRRGLYRRANLYTFPPLPALDAPIPPPLAPADFMASATARLAGWFGLKARLWGVNTSPLRDGASSPPPATAPP